MSKYQIWNKTDDIITPIGEILTPEQWIKRFPMGALDHVKLVIGGGVINGAVCMEYTGMVENYKKMGCDFSNCTTEQEHLDAIEAFEDSMNEPTNEVTPEERQAVALEAIASGATSETTAVINTLLGEDESEVV